MLSLDQKNDSGSLKNHRPAFLKHQAHNSIHPSSEQKISKMPHAMRTADNDHICAECGKCFISSSTLEKHMRNHEEEEEEDVIVCLESSDEEIEVCDQVFIDSSSIPQPSVNWTNGQRESDAIVIDDDVEEVEETCSTSQTLTNVPITNSPPRVKQISVPVTVAVNVKKDVSSVPVAVAANVQKNERCVVSSTQNHTGSLPSTEKQPSAIHSQVFNEIQTSVPVTVAGNVQKHEKQGMSLAQKHLGGLPSTGIQLSAVRSDVFNQNPFSVPGPVAVNVQNNANQVASSAQKLTGGLPSTGIQLSAVRSDLFHQNQFSVPAPVAVNVQKHEKQGLSSAQKHTGRLPSTGIQLSAINSQVLNQISVPQPLYHIQIAPNTFIPFRPAVIQPQPLLQPLSRPLPGMQLSSPNKPFVHMPPQQSTILSQPTAQKSSFTVGNTHFVNQNGPSFIDKGTKVNKPFTKSILQSVMQASTHPVDERKLFKQNQFYMDNLRAQPFTPIRQTVIEPQPMPQTLSQPVSEINSPNTSKTAMKHTGDRVYSHMCTFCDQEYSDPLALRDHMETHAVLKYLSEYKDSDSGNAPANVDSSFNGDQLVECKQEVLLSSYPGDIDDENIHVCNECGKSFKDLPALLKHIESHRKKKRSHRCSICRRHFKSIPGLKVHLRTHNIGKHSKKLGKTVAQMRLNTGTKEPPEKTDAQRKMKTVRTVRKELPDVVSTCSNEQPDESEEPEDSKEEVALLAASYPLISAGLDASAGGGDQNVHVCNQCWRSFDNIESLSDHMRTHFERVMHRCSHCRKEFRTSTSLKLHARIHTLGKIVTKRRKTVTHRKLYLCRYCEKTFWSSSGLHNHMYIHVGKRPYGCPVCRRRFIQSSDVKKHLPTHFNKNKKRQYFRPKEVEYKVCPECNVRFKYQSDLDKHMLAVHQEQSIYINCDECVMGFTEPSQLWDHLALHRFLTNNGLTSEPTV